MAKIQGVFTGITGKVGNTIFQMLNGTQIMKTFVVPANPQSAGQVAQRGVFADIISCFKSIANGVIDVFWNPFTTGNKTGWGNFISANLLSMGKVAFDITKGVLTVGSLEPVSSVSATYDTSDGDLVVTYSNDKVVNGADSDEISAVVVDADSGKVIGKFLAEDTRDSGTLNITAESGYTATNIELFIFASQDGFISTGNGLVSNSANCTCTAPA